MRRLGTASLRRLWSRLPADSRDECGNAVVELALFLALIGVPMLLGTAQMGILIYDSIEVANAANAAALWGTYSIGHASSTAAITSAAQSEAPDFPSATLGNSALTVTPTTFYYCAQGIAPPGTKFVSVRYTTQASAAAVCSAASTSNEILQFLQVSTSVTVTPFIHCPGMASTYTLTGNAVMQVQQ